MICASVLFHFALILFATDNDITFTNALESTKKLCTFKFDILKVNKNGGKSVFASIVKALSTDSREPEDVPDPMSEEALLPDTYYPSVRRRMSHWLVIFVSSNIEIFA